MNILWRITIVQSKRSLEIAPISVIARRGKKLFEGPCFFQPIPLRRQIPGRGGSPGRIRRAVELAINLEKFLPKSANRSNRAMADATAVDKSLFTQISR